MSDHPFDAVAERWLGTLPQDLKDFIHVVCDDPELDDELRLGAADAVLYTLTPGDVVPDSMGPLGYVDDALALRVVLGAIAEKAPARFAHYQERLPEMTGSLTAELDAARELLGADLDAFQRRVFAQEKIEWRGKTAREALEDPSWLELEVNTAALKMHFKPAGVADAIRRLPTLVQMFHDKLGRYRG